MRGTGNRQKKIGMGVILIIFKAVFADDNKQCVLCEVPSKTKCHLKEYGKLHGRTSKSRSIGKCIGSGKAVPLSKPHHV
jgi:hypothetical protein